MYYTKGNKGDHGFDKDSKWEKEYDDKNFSGKCVDGKCNEDKCDDGKCDYGKEWEGKGIDCCPTPEVPEGKCKTYTNHYNVKGGEYCVTNKNYYNNYYNRYNDYKVKECNYVKNFVKDCNVFHYDSETIYCGCEYLGCKNIVDHDKCGKKHDDCCC